MEVRWPKAHRIDEIHIQPGAPQQARPPGAERVPLDYRLQFPRDGAWVEATPPVTNARRYREFDPKLRAYLIQDDEFEYSHRFPAVSTRAIRIDITRSSVPENRATAPRAIEVFASK